MAVSGSITIARITAQLEGDIDKKLGYFVEIDFKGVKKVTETIPGQVALKWENPLTIPLTDNDFAASDIQIVMAINTDDGKGKKEFFADGYFKFSEVKSQAKTKSTLSVSDKKDKKRKQRGNITFEVEIKRDSKASQPQQRATATTNKGPVGTLIIQPKSGLLKGSGAEAKKIKPSVIVVLGDQALQTNPSENSGYSPIWKDALSFEMKGNEKHIIFRVIDSSASPGEETIGEALIPFRDLAEELKEGPTEFNIDLDIESVETKKIITVGADYIPQVISNPLKMYPSIEIKKGEYVCKKIRYTNPDSIKKTIIIQQFDQPNLVQPRTSEISISPNNYSEIRFKILAPIDPPEQRQRIDIFVKETGKTEETLIFDLIAI